MDAKQEIARLAATLVVDEGLEYGPAKAKAAKQLRIPAKHASLLPDNEQIELEVRAYIAELDDPAIAAALDALRASAAQLMRWFPDCAPSLGGAVWRGTASPQTDIQISLYTDDSKSVEIQLASRGVDYAVSQRSIQGELVDVLSFTIPCDLPDGLAVAHLTLRAARAERGSLKREANGMPLHGSLAQLEKLLSK